MARMRAGVWLTLAALSACADTEAPDPRRDLYFADPALRPLMDWVTLQLTFDNGSLVPDMAAGDCKANIRGTPAFEPGVKGLALVAGPGSGQGIYARAGNAPFGTQGAISLWLRPLEWTHRNGPNTTFLMTSNSSFYIQRQGPAHNEEDVVTRHEGLQFLMLSEVTGNKCLMRGTAKWPLGKWRLVIANWNWPSMSLSVDGGDFSPLTVRQSPTADLFGSIVVGASGGEKTLLDELTVYRRPLNLQEAKHLYQALKPPEEGDPP